MALARRLAAPIWVVSVSLAGCATGNDVDGPTGGSSSQGAPTSGGGESTAGGGSGGTTSTSSPGGNGGVGGEGGSGADGGVGGTGGSASSVMPSPGSLVFSEYVEGSGNNKAVEIANVGDVSISTTDCIVNRYQNGAASPAASPIVVDPVTLNKHETLVLCSSAFSQTSLCDQLSANLQHSGNDVVELVCGGSVIDVIGRIGEDAVWGTTPTITEDATLRRSCSVTSGDASGSDAFDPATEWSGFAIDTFTDLGQHGCP